MSPVILCNLLWAWGVHECKYFYEDCILLLFGLRLVTLDFKDPGRAYVCLITSSTSPIGCLGLPASTTVLPDTRKANDIVPQHFLDFHIDKRQHGRARSNLGSPVDLFLTCKYLGGCAMSQMPGVREKPGLHVLWRCLGFHTIFSLGELKAARTMFPLSAF